MALTDSGSIVVRPGRGAGSLLNNAAFRAGVYQAITLAAVVGGLWYLVSNTITNMSQRGMAAGFDFLSSSAGFSVSFTLIPYSESDSYWRVFQVGMANTLLVAVVAAVISTALGLIIGLARLSNNWVIRNLSRWYVEILRNTPLLLQIIAWYFGVFTLLPNPRASMNWGDSFFLNNRGLYFPAPVPESGFGLVLLILAGTIAAVIGYGIWARGVRLRTGRILPVVLPSLAALIVIPALGFLALGSPMSFDTPALQGLNFRGGINVPPAFCALIIALSVYTSCFIAETIRAGIQSVGRGQTEAAKALGVSSSRTMQSIILPQALRVIIPPSISQYLNLTKNSSLAIAIGFPDLVSVWMNTALNQSGRAIPIVAMTMAFYCVVSLSVSLLLNFYNRRVLLKER
jgi:general L-amino acid transport system permease protein